VDSPFSLYLYFMPISLNLKHLFFISIRISASIKNPFDFKLIALMTLFLINLKEKLTSFAFNPNIVLIKRL